MGPAPAFSKANPPPVRRNDFTTRPGPAPSPQSEPTAERQPLRRVARTLRLVQVVQDSGFRRGRRGGLARRGGLPLPEAPRDDQPAEDEDQEGAHDLGGAQRLQERRRPRDARRAREQAERVPSRELHHEAQG